MSGHALTTCVDRTLRVCVKNSIEMSNYQYFSIDDCIGGYHIYKHIWTAPIGEYLACKQEFGNLHDPYAVAVTCYYE